MGKSFLKKWVRLMSELDAKLKTYRLNKDEYARINELLGRPPQGIEWALFSALWSEHCSYKSSRIHLKKFYSKSKRVLQGFGENAGVIDLGEGEKVAFKMESHNHPSFIEPYQGAATGVGGILRDIFTMGARPIALGNYLCFGDPSADRMSHLVDGVVRGISGYGNCVGVPTVTGQTEFHSSYDKNILVNAFALGLFEEGDPIVTSAAKGVGNWVVYVGAKTGRDGVHGASMASEAFDKDSASKRPTVQIGDPFFEKLLIESCIDVMAEDLVVSIQDMGAAGLTSSSFEMSAKGNVGLKMHLDQVPLRDPTMGPEEILLSESQERMLLICEPAKFEALKKVFTKWGLDAQTIGEVTKGPNVDLYWHGEQIVSISPQMLTDEAPQYERPYKEWTWKNKKASVEENSTLTFSAELNRVLGSVQGGSRDWIYRQYDQRVGGKTARDSSESVAVLRLKSDRGLGIVLGLRPQVMRMDAKLGAMDAILYPAAELSAKGFEPLAATDCLNYGNPEKPEIMSEFVASVEGISSACEALDTPVISGNVSFYNETLGQNITSTPSIGLVGLKTSMTNIPFSKFQKAGQSIYLWRLPQVVHTGQMGEDKSGVCSWSGELDVKKVASWCRSLQKVVNEIPLVSTRLVGKYGLGYALARMCTDEIGFQVTKGDFVKTPPEWFLERMYEVLMVVESSQGAALEKRMKSFDGSQSWKIGDTALSFADYGEGKPILLTDLGLSYSSCWRTHFEQLA
jgi:phosphoribosylformylglycinamidine synthase subunit PurL